MQNFYLSKQNIVTSIFILVSLLVYGFFPTNDSFQQIITMLVFFVILPMLFSKFILKNDFDVFNITIGNWKQGLIWSGYSLLCVGFIFIIAVNFFDFFKYYSVPVVITESFIKFIIYEFTITILFVAIYEFYLRGFVMFAFESTFKYWAIFLQALLFLILFLSMGGASVYLFLPYLIFAPFAGWIAYKSRSILYSAVSQFLIIFILNAIGVKMIS